MKFPRSSVHFSLPASNRPLVGLGGVLAALLAASCGSPSDDEGDATPPTANFSSIQESVFTPTCAISGCHDISSSEAGLNMESNVCYDNIVSVSSTQLSTMARITPGDPDESYLWHKLKGTHTTAGGSGSRMPIVGSLTQEQLDVIEEWIINGALND